MSPDSSSIPITPDTPTRKIPLSMEIGSTGLNWFWPGYVREEFLPELVGKQATEVYNQMGSNDPTVAALLFVVEMLFRSVPWYVQKAGDEPQDIEAAEFLESCMEDMQNSWASFSGEISSEFQYGYAPFEVVYKKRQGDTDDYTTSSKYDDGLVGWNKISIRSQNTIQYWHFDQQGVLRGLWQLAPPLYRLVFIPMERMLLFRTKSSKGNPEGKSILRACYRPWMIKKTLEDIRNIGLERGLAGIPRFWLPPEIASPTAEDNLAVAAKNSWIEVGKSIRQDSQSCIIMPLAYDEKGNKQYDMDLVTTPGAGAAEITATIKEKSVEILQSALAEFIMLGVSAGGVGSYALSQDKTNMFLKSLETYLSGVDDTLNRHAVPRLFKLNPKFAIKKHPEIKHKPLRDVDLATVAQLLGTMKNTGASIFPDLELENFLREAMGLPLKSEEQAEAEKAKAAAQPPALPGAPQQPTEAMPNEQPKEGAELAGAEEEGANAEEGARSPLGSEQLGKSLDYIAKYKLGLPEAREKAGKRYLYGRGLEKVEGLPQSKINELKTKLVENYDDKEAFIESVQEGLGESHDPGLIYDNETHIANGKGEVEYVRRIGAQTKTWHTSQEMNLCEKCSSMDGETVPVGEPFSNGEMTAHGHPGCNCSMSFGFDGGEKVKGVETQS